MLNKLKSNRTLLGILLLGILAFALPITLLLLRDSTNLLSRAALPDQLESESGVLSSTGVSKQSDSQASGGQYIRFAKSASGPTPTSPPSQSGYGPRTAPSTPTGSNVRTIPDSIDGSGNTDVSTAILNFVNNSPDGSIIVFPKNKTYKIVNGMRIENRNNLTFWGYGATIYAAGCNSHSTTPFRLKYNKNIKILGFRIRGDNVDAGTRKAWGQHGCGEFSMGITLNTSNDGIEIADNHISNVYGDGIFLYTFEQPQNLNLNFHHNLIELTGRQGITINEGTNINIEWNIVRDAAMSLIATEDQGKYNTPAGASLENVYIRNNIFSNWNWYHRQFEILSSTAGNPTTVTTKTDHNFYNTWYYFYGHSGIRNGYVYEDGIVLDSRRLQVPVTSSGGGATGTIEHYWSSAAFYGSNKAEHMTHYKNIYIENNYFSGGDVDLHRDIKYREEFSYNGTISKDGIYIRNNTLDLPADQRSGPAVRIRNAIKGEISGNDFNGQAVYCTDCSNMIIQNNN